MKVQAAKKSCSTFLLIFLVASTLPLIQTTTALAKPSTPQFTAKFVDLSYDTSTTYGIDPYTGNSIVTQQGYRIDNRSIEFTIKNQPLSSPPQTSGNITGLFFNFRMKGAYGTEWNDYYPFAPDGQSTSTYGGIFPYFSEIAPAPAFSQSNGEYTSVTITIPGVWRVPQGAPLDVQVQAIAGYMYYQDKQYHFVGQYSDWSNSQTVIVTGPRTPNDPALPYPEQFPINSQNPSATQPPVYTPWNATSTPIQPDTKSGIPLDPDWMPITVAVLAVTVAVLASAIAIMWHNSRKKTPEVPNP